MFIFALGFLWDDFYALFDFGRSSFFMLSFLDSLLRVLLCEALNLVVLV